MITQSREITTKILLFKTEELRNDKYKIDLPTKNRLRKIGYSILLQV